MSLDRLTAALADRYRLERELGQGGMATVYLAHDLRHDRQVALKVLRPELAAVIGAERFLHEIRTTANLQHPHILPLFDSGTVDGTVFYVMPFVQGESLRDRLTRDKQLPIDDAVRITREVASALDYAHRHGVIHRDIKPENILLHDGQALVADFGIALAASSAGGSRMTETGMSLGTPHYMSPEQAMGEREITPRSDVYALGCVLYEMLTGDPPFTGSTAQAIVAQVITEDPRPPTQRRKTVPANVEAAAMTALAKLPADRFATARDFAQALGTPEFRATAASPRAPGAMGSREWRARVAVPALVLAGLLAIAAAGLAITRPPAVRVSRYEIAWPAVDRGTNASIDVSPDGSMFALATGSGDLVIRRRDQLEATPLRDTEGAFNPSFSPDGREIAFQVGSALRVMSVDGEAPPRTVADSMVGVPGLDWGPDGYLYYDHRGIGPLLRARVTGGAPEAVGALDTTTFELQHVFPDVLPNGRGVIVTINRGGPGRQGTANDGIGVVDLRTGRHRELVRGIFARYSPSGHLLYVTAARELMAVGFDAGRFELTGAPVSLATGIALRSNGAADLAIAADGTLYYSVSAGTPAANRLVWIARDGSRSPFTPAPGPDVRAAEVSPDGRRVAYLDTGGGAGLDVWIAPIGPGRPERLTFESTVGWLTWSHDGRSLIVSSSRDVVKRLDATAGAVLSPMPGSPPNATAPQESPDGTALVYARLVGGSDRDVMILPLGPDTVARPLIATRDDERSPVISPDGRWIAYQSGPGLDGVLLAKPFPDAQGTPRQLTTTRGGMMRWSRDGHELFYISRSFRLQASADTMRVLTMRPGADLAVTGERSLFAATDIVWYSPSPDGRFLAVQAGQATATRRLFVVENAFEELRRRVPR
jgi:serine/threonine-protein kinase